MYTQSYDAIEEFIQYFANSEMGYLNLHTKQFLDRTKHSDICDKQVLQLSELSLTTCRKILDGILQKGLINGLTKFQQYNFIE